MTNQSITVKATGPFEVTVKPATATLVAIAIVESIRKTGFDPRPYMKSAEDREANGAVPAFEAMVSLTTWFLHSMVVMGFIEVDDSYYLLFGNSVPPSVISTKIDQPMNRGTSNEVSAEEVKRRLIKSWILVLYLFPSYQDRILLLSAVLMQSGIHMEGEPLEAFFNTALASVFMETLND